MADRQDITGFHSDEDVDFTFAARDRDGTTVLTGVASATFTIEFMPGPGEAATYTFTDSDSEVTLTSEANGIFTITIATGALANLVAGRRCYYAVKTAVSGDTILQKHGWFMLRQ